MKFHIYTGDPNALMGYIIDSSDGDVFDLQYVDSYFTPEKIEEIKNALDEMHLKIMSREHWTSALIFTESELKEWRETIW